MAHMLDTTNGQTSFVSAREDAWHQLGQVLPDSFTAEEAMEHGLLGGWNVRKTPVVAALETGEMLAMPGRYAVVRDNPVTKDPEVIGNVGELYHIIQNEEHAGLLNALVEESGAHFETAGSLDGGKRVFITMKLQGHINVGGVDPVENYIAAINSHDGSTAFTLMVTPVRIVCQNTLNVAFSKAKSTYRVRHSSGASKALHQEARKALDLTFNYLEGFQEEAERLINTTMTQMQFDELLVRNFGAPSGSAPGTITRAENKIDEISSLFTHAYTQEGIRNTAWAGFNALTEWSDHFHPTRGSAQETSRAVKAVMDPFFKNTALQAIRSAI